MSDCERFSQIAQDKWVTVSKSLRSLMTNEKLWANCSGCSWQMSNRERNAQVDHDKRATVSKSLRLLFRSQKMSDLLKRNLIISYFYVRFLKSFCKLKKRCSFSLFGDNRERITQVAHQKWANEQIAHFFGANCSFAHLLQKTCNLLRKQMSKFPTLQTGITHWSEIL